LREIEIDPALKFSGIAEKGAFPKKGSLSQSRISKINFALQKTQNKFCLGLIGMHVILLVKVHYLTIL